MHLSPTIGQSVTGQLELEVIVEMCMPLVYR